MVDIRDNKGNVLFLTLMTAIILIVLSGSYLSLVVAEHSMNMRASHSIAAINVAEAGAEEALWELKFGGADFAGWSGVNPVSNSGELFAPGGEKIGEYYVEVENPDDFSPVIEAVGYVPAQPGAVAERTVRIKAEGVKMFGKAVFGKEGVVMSSNARTDSYDSKLGLYNVNGNKGTEGDIGTDATGSDPPAVLMNSNARVNGNVWIGMDGNTQTDIELKSNALINGRRKKSSSPTEMPAVQGDSSLPAKPPIVLNGNDTATISSSGKYSTITLKSNSALTITADATIYITGALSLNSNSKLKIANGAKVEMYVDGSISFSSNTQVNNLSKDPTKFALYATDSLTSTVTYNSNTSFYGTLYSKNAPVVFNSNASLYGAIVGKDVELNSNATVHYDLALRDVGPTLGYEISYWQEK
jgi:hypothetical protein